MKGPTRRFYLLFGLLMVLLGLTVTTGHAQPQTDQKISAPGQYSGYTSPEYKSFAVTSQYVTMRDGVRMYRDSEHASYIELPVIGEVAQLPLPSSTAPEVAALPSTGSGPEDSAFHWMPVVWLLVGGGAAATAGAFCIRFAWGRRRSGGR